jgi:hypothetical protein
MRRNARRDNRHVSRDVKTADRLGPVPHCRNQVRLPRDNTDDRAVEKNAVFHTVFTQFSRGVLPYY